MKERETEVSKFDVVHKRLVVQADDNLAKVQNIQGENLLIYQARCKVYFTIYF